MFEDDRWYIVSYHGPTQVPPVLELLTVHRFEFPWSDDVTEETGTEQERNAAIWDTFGVDVSDWMLIGAGELGPCGAPSSACRDPDCREGSPVGPHAGVQGRGVDR